MATQRRRAGVYGAEHKSWAKRLPSPEGQPCPRCGLPMRKAQGLELGHVVDAALGGDKGARRWEHARCNRIAGAALGGRMRGRWSGRRNRRGGNSPTGNKLPTPNNATITEHSEEWFG